jgi:succinate dehydrogenase / fumarate reductase, cytochrome b subunit
MSMTERPTPTGTRRVTSAPPVRSERRSPAPWAVAIYRSGIGKKYVMAITGIVLMGYVLAHMLGNLKFYLGAESINRYGEYLRVFGEPILPEKGFLWMFRVVIIGAFALHIHAAYGLTVMNRKARPEKYASRRDWAASDFASRTMRWSGVIVLLFLIFHLLDLTWGTANPGFVHGDVYRNMVASFERWPVAIAYVVANLALGLHLYHGAWSLFQSMGWSNRRFDHWRRYFAVAFAAVVTLGNVSFPIAVLTGVVS